MLVVDASVLVVALADDTAFGDEARHRLRGERLAAPELIDLEVISALRKLVRVGLSDVRRAELAMADLVQLPMDRAPHTPLLSRVWELRDNLTAYDASYVALAEVVDASLLTADARLAQSPGPLCPIEVLEGT